MGENAIKIRRFVCQVKVRVKVEALSGRLESTLFAVVAFVARRKGKRERDCNLFILIVVCFGSFWLNCYCERKANRLLWCTESKV